MASIRFKKIEPTPAFFGEILLFLFVQLLGLYSASWVIKQPDIFPLPVGQIKFSWETLAFLVMFGFLFVWVARRKGKFRTIFFKTTLALAIYSGSQLALISFLGANWATLISFLIIMAFLFFNRVFIQDFAMILALAGIGSFLGLSILALTAAILLCVFSFYDIVAVYKTKHMVALANAMIDTNAISGMIIPARLDGFFKKVKNIQPGGDFTILGSGDILMPLVLSTAVLKFSAAGAIIVLIFSVGGLFLTHLLFISQPEQRPMAALPPIAAMAIIGYFISTLIK